LGSGGSIWGAWQYFLKKEQAQAFLAGMAHPTIFQYQRKIKEALDPNEVGDGSYLYLEEPGK